MYARSRAASSLFKKCLPQLNHLELLNSLMIEFSVTKDSSYFVSFISSLIICIHTYVNSFLSDLIQRTCIDDNYFRFTLLRRTDMR